MRKAQIFSIFSLLFFSCFGLTSSEYQYTLLDPTGATLWKIQANDPRLKNNSSINELSPEEQFQKIKIEKKHLTTQELVATYPKLAQPHKIAILGDTGCRLKESALKRTYQDCSNPKKWPFPAVMKSLEKEKPDFIIHLGDYHYREQCTPGKPCQRMSPSVGYGWEPWKLDFFEPSKTALKQSPWLIVRGNHEDCNRAFLGYKTLLRTVDWQHSCDDTDELQIITLGNLAIINLDSSAITDMPDFSEKSQALWKKHFDSLNAKIISLHVTRIWLVTHKPAYGLVRLAGTFAPVNMNLRKYLENASWTKKVEVIFGGHIHNSQITRTKDSPLQLVIGNGGTELDSSKKIPTEENLNALNYEKARFIDHDFGYVIATDIETENPKLEFHEANGKIIFSCHTKNKGEDCF